MDPEVEVSKTSHPLEASSSDLDDIWSAAKEGDVQRLGKAMAGALPEVLNAIDNFDNTALYYASHNGHTKCVKMLLSRGALDDDQRCYRNAAEHVRPILREHHNKIAKGRKLKVARRTATEQISKERRTRLIGDSSSEISREEFLQKKLERAVEATKQKKYFRLKRKHLGLDELKAILSDLIANGITELDLRKCGIGEKGVSVLFDLLKQEEGVIHSLFLFKNEIGDNGCQVIGKHLGDQTFYLSKLNLCQNNLTSLSARYISFALFSNQTLQALDMNNNEVGDEGAVYLAQALLKNRTLHTLSLWNNGLTYRAAEAFGTTLAQIPKEEKVLWRLNLENNPEVSKENIEHIKNFLVVRPDGFGLDDEELRWYLRYLFSTNGAVAEMLPQDIRNHIPSPDFPSSCFSTQSCSSSCPSPSSSTSPSLSLSLTPSPSPSPSPPFSSILSPPSSSSSPSSTSTSTLSSSLSSSPTPPIEKETDTNPKREESGEEPTRKEQEDPIHKNG